MKVYQIRFLIITFVSVTSLASLLAISAEDDYRDSIFRENCIIIVEGSISEKIFHAKIPHQDENGDVDLVEYQFSTLEVSKVKFSALDLIRIIPIFEQLFRGNAATVSIPVFCQSLDPIVPENKVNGFHILQYSPGSWGFYKDVFLQTQNASEIERLIKIASLRKVKYIPEDDINSP